MIPRTDTIVQTKDWQNSLATAIKSVDELLAFVGISDHPDAMHDEFKQFPLRVPVHYANKIEHGNIDDPLLKQVLPNTQELEFTPGYTTDPLAEQTAAPAPGIIHKYHGRVLLMLTGACAIHCRYCFRRHFPYEEHRPSKPEQQQTLDYLTNHPSINEVIFSGGDPLAVNDKHLEQWLQAFAAIPHITRLRFHTRLPAVIPERITDELITLLTASNKQLVFVFHINHPNELCDDIAIAVAKLKNAGITVFNQTVLLNDVNDNAATLANLSEYLFRAGILPYYLHVLDKVAGAAHFNTSLNRSRQIYTELSQLLPGYLLPKLVQERAGEPAKTLLLPA